MYSQTPQSHIDVFKEGGWGPPLIGQVTLTSLYQRPVPLPTVIERK
jgi:hypothetical protein